MQLAEVQGRAISTIRHASFAGRKLLLCQRLGADSEPVGDPVLALDTHGAGAGDRVILTSDGQGLRALLGSEDSPVRWWTLGIADH